MKKSQIQDEAAPVGLIFKFETENRFVTVRVEAILCNSYRLSILKPEGFEDFPIGGLHIPGFGYPMFFGYLYDNTLLLPKFYKRLRTSVSYFFMQYDLFARELPTVRKLSRDGCREEDIKEHFYKNFNVQYAFGELPKFLRHFNVQVSEE